MKITFIINSAGLAGGIRVISIYADRLQKLGHEVLVLSPPRRQPTLKQQVRSLWLGKGLISQAQRRPSHFDDVDVDLKEIEHPAPITDADLPDADVVVATFWKTADWVAQLSESKGAKVYFIQHHEIHDYFPIERVKATYRLPMHKITICKWLVDVMRTEYGDTNVSLVPNSIDTQIFYAPPRDKQPIPTVGMMYSQKTWKGCDVSLKAFSLAAQKIPNLNLVAFGTEKPSADLPLPPDTEYFCQPPQHRIKDIYAKCDAWLFGSRVEGFGLPILEAMACRTPVIGTPAGAAPELLTDGAGILVKPEDPEDMARAIEQICQLSEQEWRAMSDAAYAKASSYTWDDAAKLCEQAFYTAIERTKRGDFSNQVP